MLRLGFNDHYLQYIAKFEGNVWNTKCKSNSLDVEIGSETLSKQEFINLDLNTQ